MHYRTAEPCGYDVLRHAAVSIFNFYTIAMSLLKNILKPFVEFEEDQKQQPAKPQQPAAEKKPPTPPASGKSTSNTPPVQTPAAPEFNIPVPSPAADVPSGPAIATASPEHKAYFENLIEDANAKNPLFQGTDFKEFIDSKSDIDTIADEATRYRTAFSVLKRTGLTKQRLLSTGHEYLNLIGRALNSYQGAFTQQYQKDVRSREAVLQKKAEEVQALNQKIAALKADMKIISDEITASKQKLDANKASFLAAGEMKQTEIQQELQKIEQYF
jgi:outer membrane murein-binding lipoprotein Lpp